MPALAANNCAVYGSEDPQLPAPPFMVEVSLSHVHDSMDATTEDQEGSAGGERAAVPTGMRPLHSELPPHCYVSVHAEARVTGSDTWTSVCATSQPFKSVVDTNMRAVYFHKDMRADFYGEVWAYDEHVISLRQET